MNRFFCFGVTFFVLTLLNTGCSSMNSSKNSETGEVYFSSGVSSLSTGSYSEALSSFVEANRLMPNRADVLTFLGIAHNYKENFSEAEAAFRSALKNSGNYTYAKANLGALLINRKRYSEAEVVIKDALKDLIYEERDTLFINLARLYKATNRSLLAEQQLRFAVKENLSNCSAWLELGYLQRDQGEFSESVDSLSNAVKGTCYNNPEAHYQIGDLLLKTKNVAGAKSKFLDVIELFPSSNWAKKAETTLHLLE